MEQTPSTPPRERAPFEFTSQHNQVIATLSRRAMIWGGVSTAGGLVSLVAAVIVGTTHTRSPLSASALVFITVPQISVGLSFLAAGRELGAVVSTEGHDIELLMEAMADFTSAIRVQIFSTVLFILAGGGLTLLSRAINPGD